MTATLKLYRVTLTHPHGYTVSVHVYDRDTTGARSQALNTYPGHTFVSVVLDEDQ